MTGDVAGQVVIAGDPGIPQNGDGGCHKNCAFANRKEQSERNKACPDNFVTNGVL